MRSLVLHIPSNILHATEQLSAGVLTFLALATRELVDAGVHQTVVYRAQGDMAAVARQFDPQVRLVPIASPLHAGPWRHLNAWRAALCSELSGRPYDAVHLHAAKAGLLGRAILSGVAGHPPVYYSPHGLPNLQRGHRLAGAMSALKERVASISTFRPVGCGLGEARELERLTHRTAAVLENPVDTAFFDVVRQPDAHARVVTVGRACAQKGADQFAELAARFHFAGESVRFVWVGAGESVSEEVLKAAGVEVTGWVEPAEVQAQLARAHVYVQASRWEGMALPVLQAMAVGLPCLATDVVGNHDTITHGATGLLAGDLSALAVQLKDLLDDPQRARALGDAARLEARERFHPARFRRSLLSLYRLEGHRAHSPRGTLDTATS
jgi:glycosyltransferase involved in cell wall biosynthesis